MLGLAVPAGLGWSARSFLAGLCPLCLVEPGWLCLMAWLSCFAVWLLLLCLAVCDGWLAVALLRYALRARLLAGCACWLRGDWLSSAGYYYIHSLPCSLWQGVLVAKLVSDGALDSLGSGQHSCKGIMLVRAWFLT